MKLIDADEFRREMYHEAFETDSDLQKWDSGCWIRYKMFENAIENFPAVDAVPVVHGMWVDNGTGGHECNVCHICAPSFRNGRENLSSYCPLCGARMS